MKNIDKDLSGLTNLEITKKLFKEGIIRSKEPDLIYKNPLKPKVLDFSKIEGMLLGIAIGDSLGNTSESMTPAERKQAYGLISDYLPNRHVHNEKIGLPSDDTQLAFDTLLVILEKGYLDMAELAKIFSSHKIFGIGSTVKLFLKKYKMYNEPWYLSGVVNGAGNGALMRIEPVLISYLRNQNESLYADAVLATMLTHNSALAIGSSVAFVNMLNKFISLKIPPKNDEFIQEFIDILSLFTGDTEYILRSKKIKSDFSHNASALISQALKFGKEKDMTTEEFGDYFGSGAYVLETDAVMLYILSKYISKPQEAILQAVNYTNDNDTLASLVGASVGALYGKVAFRIQWIKGLSGRIRESDDGKIFTMIEDTKTFLEGKSKSR